MTLEYDSVLYETVRFRVAPAPWATFRRSEIARALHVLVATGSDTVRLGASWVGEDDLRTLLRAIDGRGRVAEREELPMDEAGRAS